MVCRRQSTAGQRHLPNDRIMRWTEDSGISVFRQPSGFANGHTRDRQGRLIGCSHRDRCIHRTELDGSITILADRYQGKRLNSPNDVVVHSDGAIWFTDPQYGISTDYEGGKQQPELPPQVFRLDPSRGELTVVAGDFEGPNGLCFSPDERFLYIAETGRLFATDPVRHIRRFEVRDGRPPDQRRGLCRHFPRLRRRISLRPGWPHLDGCRGRRALPLGAGRAARQDPCRHHGFQPRLRRPQPLAPVHLRLACAHGHLHQRTRCAESMMAQRLACIS